MKVIRETENEAVSCTNRRKQLKEKRSSICNSCKVCSMSSCKYIPYDESRSNIILLYTGYNMQGVQYTMYQT